MRAQHSAAKSASSLNAKRCRASCQGSSPVLPPVSYLLALSTRDVSTSVGSAVLATGPPATEPRRK
jgi:hypothetical protein